MRGGWQQQRAARPAQSRSRKCPASQIQKESDFVGARARWQRELNAIAEEMFRRQVRRCRLEGAARPRFASVD
jgi:hypothetical protein